MSFIKETSDTLLKYGNKIVNKTEEYTHIAKLSIEIKTLESKIKKIENQIGSVILRNIKNNENFDIQSTEIHDLYNEFAELENEIELKQDEIEQINKEEENKNEKTKETEKPEETTENSE